MAAVIELSTGPRAHSAAMSGNALVLEGVTRQFGALRAIEDISFTVAAGERRAILGANGAGKTTLFNAITGDFPPTHGSVHFFGEDVTTLPPHERIRRGLRRTYQSSLLFRELSVRDNLFLAVRGGTRGRFNMRRPSRSDPSVMAAEALLHQVRLDIVGDMPVDIHAARNSGLDVAVIATGSATADELRLAKPDHFLHRFSDVIGIVSGKDA
jgi:branched-chain amino acid transport system ATP-binding protein